MLKLRRDLWALALLVVVLPARLGSQTPMPTEAKVDALFKRHTQPGSPGAAVAVIRDGEIIHSKGYGLANLELEAPITPRSAFYLGSVSKQFTATAIALLVQDGALSLDDDIRKHILEIPDYGTPITIRNLLHHTSGVRDYLTLMGLAGLPLGTFHDNQGVVDLIARQRAPNFPPGSRYLYSNSGYLLLGEIVERVSGESLRAFAERRIFTPLGMNDTHFHDQYAHLIPRRASAYFPAREGGYTAFLSTYDRVGAGGVFSTIEDLAKWDANFYHHDVGGASVHEMQHTRGVLVNGDTISYALGLQMGDHNGYRTVEHGGALGGYRSNILRLPNQRFSVIVLANVPTVAVGPLSRAIVDLYFPPSPEVVSEEPETGEAGGDQAVAGKPVVDRAEMERVTGRYWSAEGGLARHIALEEGKLLYRRGPGNQTELAAIGGGRFLMVGVGQRVVVSFTPVDGRSERMTVEQSSGTTAFEAYVLWEPDERELEVYSGSYYSDELRVSYRVRVEDSGLVVAMPATNSVRFVPIFRDTFQAPSGPILEFSTGGGDAITGFVLQAGRVRNLAFHRREGDRVP